MEARSPKTIVLIGTLDTKGDEVKYARERIEERGHKTLVVDTGVLGQPSFEPEVSRERVAQAAGADLATLMAQRDTSTAVRTMMAGTTELVKQLYSEGRLDAIMSLGGGKGTAIATAAMRELPLGVPKVAVCTSASGDTRRYMGSKDIIMFPSITDIVGLNRVNRLMLDNAVGAIVGMVETDVEEPAQDKPVASVTALGITTPAAMKCKDRLEAQGYEVMVFHTTGVGGQAMEELIAEGVISGVMDLTTTELMSELLGSSFVAGPDRLEAAGRRGIPQLVGPGGLDMVAYAGRRAVPEEYTNRLLYDHTPALTVMRTNVEDNARAAGVMAEKLNCAKGPVTIAIPTKGFSAYDQEGELFWDPEADAAFVETVRQQVREPVQVVLVDAHINDDHFVDRAVQLFLE
ncbi:MAG TPA: UPF0261 family protein, partial [Chloroflexi bacterium]|nr:UPF0261 family protein [Chloroflexota bacterium]